MHYPTNDNSKLAALVGLAALAGGTALAADRATVGAFFMDDFSSAALSPAWDQKYEPTQFTLEDGQLVGRQLNPNHGATIRVDIDKTADFVFAFDAKFSGKSSFNAVIDDPDARKVTWAGHVARFSVRRNSINLSDDLSGTFKLEHRAMSNAERKVASAPHNVSLSPPAPLNDGAWHAYRMEVRGKTGVLYLDGEKLGELTSKGFDHPGKMRFGFTVNARGGGDVRFDNVLIKPL